MNLELNKKAIGLISLNLILFIVIFILFLLTPVSDAFYIFIRLGALFGFTSIFLATTMSPFMVQLYKIFGKPFIKLHHTYSILGLIMITIHPVTYAISVMNIAVFVPVFFPWIEFWNLAGRPALILIYIAVLSALLRKKVTKYWRYFHMLNYIALLLAYVHGVLIGTDFKNLGILIIFTIMLIISFGSFGLKRYQNYKRKKKLRKKSSNYSIGSI